MSSFRKMTTQTPLLRILLCVCWSLLFSSVSSLADPLTPPTDDEAAAQCAGENGLPSAGQRAAVSAGYWVDTQNQRGAISWDLVWNDAHNQLKVIVYTYDPNGRPIWLATAMQALGADGRSWVGDLNKYTHAVQQGTKVGQIAIRFFNNDATKLAMRWYWDAIVEGQQNECLNDFISVTPNWGVGSSPVSVQSGTSQLAYSSPGVGANQPFSGYWNTSTATQPIVDSVPAFVVHIMQPTFPLWRPDHPEDRDNPPGVYVEHDTLLTWDSSGDPVWLFASIPASACFGTGNSYYNHLMPCDPPAFSVAHNAADPLNLYYTQPNPAIYTSGFPYFLPACTPADPCTIEQKIGGFGRDIGPATASTNPAQSATITVTGLSNPQKPDHSGIAQDLTSGSLFWPANSATVGSANVRKMTTSNGIVPVQYSCTVVDPSPSCVIWVAWNWTPAAGLKLYKHDLNKGTYTVVAQAGATDTVFSNEFIDSLHPFDRVQYELWTGTAPDAGVKMDSTAEVRGFPVQGQGSTPTLPDSPIVSNDSDLPDRPDLPGGHHDASVGAAAGEAGTDGGAATYHLPIAVPPGRNGMQPALALTYNSRSGNGIAGMGWSLSGASSIHRCSQTVAQDGASRAVNFSIGDRLCLDGQRLVASPSSYGFANTQYHTELESFAKVTQLSADLGAAGSWFEVKQKDGRTLTYGGSNPHCSVSGENTAPTVPPGAGSVPLTWLLQKVTDPVGNQMDYCYSSGSTNEVLLKAIYYTGTSTAAGTRKVRFNYVQRSAGSAGANDWSSSYLAGTQIVQSQILTSIETSVLGIKAKVYALDYGSGGSLHSGRSTLKKIQECNGVGSVGPGSVCKGATTLAWADAAVDHVFAPFAMAGVPAAAQDNINPRHVTSIGDLDGDGAREVLVSQRNAASPAVPRVYLAKYDADRNPQGTPVEVSSLFVSNVGGFVEDYSTDFDGDGRAELLGALGAADPLNQLHLYGLNVARGASLDTCQQPGCPLFKDVATNIPLVRYTGGGPVRGALDRVVGSADVDGDGYPDLILWKQNANCNATTLDQNVPATLCVFLNNQTPRKRIGSSTPPFNFSGGISIPVPSGITIYSTLQRADLNGDGIPDMVLSTCTSGIICNTALPVFLISRGPGSASPPGCTNAGTYFSLCTAQQLQMVLTTSSGFDARSSSVFLLDINGDGLTDLLYGSATACHSTSEPSVDPSHGYLCAQLSTGQGFDPTLISITMDVGANVALTKEDTGFRYLGRMPMADVDGDGRPDILYPQKLAARVCRIEIVQWGSTPLPEGACPGGGSDALGTAQCRYWVCPEDPEGFWPIPGPVNSDNPHGMPPINGVAVAGIYKGVTGPNGGKVTWPGDDNSAYVMGAVHIVQTGPTSFAATSSSLDASQGAGRTAHKAVGSLDSNNRALDLYGDGLTDFVVNLGCLDNTLANCYVVADGVNGPSTLPDGSAASQLTSSKQFVSENVGVGQRAGSSPMPPEMLTQVNNGIGDYAQWTYYPLSSKAARTASNGPLYTLDTSYLDDDHYVFTSSMPVVSTMVQNNPLSIGARSWMYGYDTALYNHSGRGFQGFRKITQKQMTSASVPALQLETTYQQKFPFAGKVDQRKVGLATTAGLTTPISTETNTWGCVPSGTQPVRASTCPSTGSTTTYGTSYMPYLDTSVAVTMDLASAQAGLQKPVTEVDTYNSNTAAPSGGVSGWDIYGNLTNQFILRKDLPTDFPDGAFVSVHSTQLINVYAAADTNAWWLDRLSSSELRTSTSYRSSGFDPLPARPMPPGANSFARKVVTTPLWNLDRTLSQKTVADIEPNGLQAVTSYAYPTTANYGLPSTVTVSATNLNPATRVTQLEYTPDGYFVHVTREPLGHVTTVDTRTQDGQVTQVTDPLGLGTQTTFDDFGQVTQVEYFQTNGQPLKPSIKRAVSSCITSPCTGLGEVLSKYKVTTVQDGAPTQVSWFDFLNRELKHSTRGLDGRWISSLTTYDQVGDKRSQTAPFFEGDTKYTTTFDYDALHRMTKKVQPTAQLDPPDNTNSSYADLTTIYSYAGNRTDISVRALSMSRYTSVVGELMRTVDANGKTTDFWYDGSGHTIGILDASRAHPTVATYDALGNRKALNDPNQGTWTFSYNGLGELLTQTDARSVTTTLVRDELGRVRTQSVALPNPIPAGMDANATVDTWTWDPPGGYGLLDKLTRVTGTKTTWAEQYAYFPTSKFLNFRRTTIDGFEGNTPTDELFVTQYRYDAHYARQKSITYPSGFTVWKQYGGPNGDYGDLTALADGDTLAPLWGLYQANAYRQPKQEQFGYSLKGVTEYEDRTGQMKAQDWTTVNGGAWVDHAEYTYDAFGNLDKRGRQTDLTTAATTEGYLYDSLQRLKSAGPLPARNAVRYYYDDVGNLTGKTDYSLANPNNTSAEPGMYHYGGTCGPNFATSVETSAQLDTFACDPNGNIIGGSVYSPATTYNAANLPTKMVHANGTAQFAYDPSNQRSRENTGTWTYFTGDGYERTGVTKDSSLHRHELGPVVITTRPNFGGGHSLTAYYELRDRLGSTLAVVDDRDTTQNGIRHLDYDAFGKSRDPKVASLPFYSLGLSFGDITTHGFTNHEHVDAVKLIHMNGRMYDYTLGRFVSVDPVIQNKANSQSLNPYSYIGNNPLSGTDPSGYEAQADCPDGKNCAPSNEERDEHDGFKTVFRASGGGSHRSGTQTQPATVVSGDAQVQMAPSNRGTMGGNLVPLKPEAAGAGAGGGDDSGLTTQLLDTIEVRPYGALRDELHGDEIASQDAKSVIFAPLGLVIGVGTATNPWQQNAPGNDSIQSATMPGAWGIGAKGAAMGLGILRNAKRAEETYEVLSDISPEALRFLSTGRETQVYLGFRDGRAVYCGISCNVARRQSQHGGRFDIQEFSPMMPRGQARAIEQAMILRNPHPQFVNERNSISPGHVYYTDAVRWGESWLQANGH